MHDAPSMYNFFQLKQMHVIRNLPVPLLFFFPQLTDDKHNGGTLANMQGNLV